MGLSKKKVGFYLEDMDYGHDKGFNNEEHFLMVDNAENERDKEIIREKIFRNNIPLSKYIMNKCVSRIQYTCEYTRTTLDEFYAIGFAGLWKAVQTFDVSQGIKFITFASTVIRNDYNMFLRTMKRSYSVKISSLDAPLYKDEDGSELTGLDMLADQVDLISSFEDLDMVDSVLKHATKSLTDRELGMFYLYLEGLNQRQIAEKYSITQSCSSRVLKRIKNKLRKYEERVTS